MTDDKNYIWIKVLKQLDFPTIKIVREKQEKSADYFGPFPNTAPIRRMLKRIRKVFPYRSCNRKIEKNEDGSIESSNTKPCLYFHIGLCTAPCSEKQSKQDYRDQVNQVKQFFRSEHSDIKKDLEKKMKHFSKEKNYEKAAEYRDKLYDLKYLTQYSKISKDIDDETIKLQKKELAQQGLKNLIERLDLEPEENFRIECYDISNIQGSNATGSMVVWQGSKMQKNLYRKFKIKIKETPDDFAMMQEVLQRRLKYLLKNAKKQEESFSQKPNLIVVDGGKGQLSSALEIIKKFEPSIDYKIPCIGLAKREEEVFVIDENNPEKTFRKIKFTKRDPALKILQNLRDEAHRFGIGYHKLLRSKGMVYSELDLIPGVGEVTKKKLILAFGSVDGIRKASLEDINSVIRNRSTAKKIKKLLV
jgi:excinuclease ABC subunit C